MLRHGRKLMTLLALVVLALAACAPPDPGEIIPTRTPLPPPTDTPIPPTVTPTTTPIPTLTPTPRPQPSPTPEMSLAPGGPWLVFSAMPDPARTGRFGLFAVNADGTGLTHLSDDVVQAFAGQQAASPASSRVAYTALATGTEAGEGVSELLLRLARLPGGQVTTAARLTPPGYTPPASRAEDEARWQAYEVSRSQAPIWASDADHIAYVGFNEGPTADVYLYNLFTGTTVRLSSEAGQAVNPLWSPDGRFIAYGVQHNPEPRSTGLVDEVRVAWTNGTGDELLYPPAESGERLFGWLEYDTVLVASSAAGCAYERLRAVEVDSGAEFMLWPGHFRQAVFDPATGAVLLEAGALSSPCEGDVSGVPAGGIYLIPLEGEPRAVLGEEAVQPADPVQTLRWAESQGAFVATFGGFGALPSAVLSITPGGDVTEPQRPPGVRSVVSPDGEWMAWHADGSTGERGLWVGPRGDLPQPVFAEPVQSVTWAPDGRTLFFFRPPGGHGPDLYVAHGPSFRPEPLVEDVLIVREPAWVHRPR